MKMAVKKKKCQRCQKAKKQKKEKTLQCPVRGPLPPPPSPLVDLAQTLANISCRFATRLQFSLEML